MTKKSATLPPSQTNSAPIPQIAFILIMFFFLLSGISGLIYEVIWSRLLQTVFGATLYAVCTVLAAFMGGLALGSFAGGLAADRIRKPLLMFGIMQIAIGVTAFSVPWMLQAFNPIYRAVYASGAASFLQLSLIRFALTVMVLIIPTACMGATLPLLARFLVRRGGTAGTRIGALYTINTFGAVVGTFSAGFILLARLGIHGTTLFAVALNVAVGVGAMVLSWMIEHPTEPGTANETPPEPAGEGSAGIVPAWLARIVLITYGISGFVALSYQVFWSRTLVFRFEYLKNTTYSFSAMLTVFLVGLTLGSAVMSSRIDRQRNPVRLYGLIQILIGLSGAFSLFMLISYADLLRLGEPLNPVTFEFNWILAVANVFLRTVATIGLPTFLMGMAFPVVVRIYVSNLDSVGAGTGRLFAVNTIGSILGAFASGFILVPILGLSRGLLVLGLINVLLGVLVLTLNPADEPKRKMTWAAMAIVVFGVFFMVLPKHYVFQELMPNHRMLAYKEGPLATVAVWEDSLGHRTLSIDAVDVAGTDRILLTDQKSLAHLPLLMLENPRSALTVGFGSGGASYSYTLYSELEQIDCIEISETVPEMADLLLASNHGLLNEPVDPRYRLIFDDARSYLQFTDVRYDVIATDCTDLRYKSNANLYDVEYFQICRDAITEDGMVVVWMPLGGMSPEVFNTAMATFAHVFPDMTVWYMHNDPTHYLLLIGMKKPFRINLEQMIERISRPGIANDLAEVSLHQPEKFLASYLTSGIELADALAGAPLNTENMPYLEFESPKYGYTDEPLLVNLAFLLGFRRSVASYIEDADAHPDFMERLKPFEDVVETLLDGFAAYRRLEFQEACRIFMRAAEIAPEDASIQYALSFHDLRRRVEINPNDLWANVTLGEIDLIQGNYREAANTFDRAIRLAQAIPPGQDDMRFLARSAVGLATCYAELGQPERALRFLDRFSERIEGDSAVQALRAELEK